MKVNKQTDKREHAGTATYIYIHREILTHTLCGTVVTFSSRDFADPRLNRTMPVDGSAAIPCT